MIEIVRGLWPNEVPVVANDVYITRFCSGDKTKQVRVPEYDFLPEFSKVFYNCSDCGKENHSYLNEDAKMNKAHFANRDGKPICYMCWKTLLDNEEQRVRQMFYKLKVGQMVSICSPGSFAGYKTSYFRRTSKMIMVTSDILSYKPTWKRHSIDSAVRLWRKYEGMKYDESS